MLSQFSATEQPTDAALQVSDHGLTSRRRVAIDDSAHHGCMFSADLCVPLSRRPVSRQPAPSLDFHQRIGIAPLRRTSHNFAFDAAPKLRISGMLVNAPNATIGGSAGRSPTLMPPSFN